MIQGSKIAIVVGNNPMFGLQLLAGKMEVWAPDLPHYVIVRERMKGTDAEGTLTLFDADLQHTPEQQLLSWLPKIIEEYRQNSMVQGWTVLEVHGVKVSEEIAAMLKEYNPSSIDLTSFGFRVTRAVESRAKNIDLSTLYGHLLELFRKMDNGPELKEFILRIGKPSEIASVGISRFFYYWDLGLTITSYHGIIGAFGFHFDTAGVRAGEIEAYAGNLPAGIKWSDSCKQVEEKLGVSPERAGWVRGCQADSCDAISSAGSFWQHYEIPPYHYTFIFHSDQCGLSLIGLGPSRAKKNPDETGE